MDIGVAIVGTCGGYDDRDHPIEVGFSVVLEWQGRGLRAEALRRVLEYLTENEGIASVTAAAPQ